MKNYNIQSASNTLDSTANKAMVLGNIDKSEIGQVYADVCKAHQLNNKWIMMIDPEDEALNSICFESELDTKKILKVDTDGKQLSLETLEKTLKQGNCSAVIVGNKAFDSESMARLNKCAQAGNTTCVVLDKIIH